MHQIRYFLAVSRTLNFTRAAEECHVAQPSLTRAIKLLEEEFGCDLFRRERKYTHLTEFGQRMLPFLTQSYESALTAKSVAKAIRTGAVAPLVLALSKSIDVSILIAPLTELTRSFPGLELRFQRGALAEIFDMLKKGDVEVAVAEGSDERWERLDYWPLFSEPLTVVLSQDHKFANRASIDVSALMEQRLLLRPYCDAAERALRLLRQNNHAIARSHELVSDDDLIKLVDANLGVGILPASTTCPPHLKRLPLDGFPVERVVALYGVAGRQRPPAAAAFMKMLRAMH
jgi:DNA-binding transcriptional LysR family regulator